MTLPMASILATLGADGAASISALSTVGGVLMPSAGKGEWPPSGCSPARGTAPGAAAAFASAVCAVCSKAAGRSGVTDVVMKMSTSR
jgi:hypothetical protein